MHRKIISLLKRILRKLKLIKDIDPISAYKLDSRNFGKLAERKAKEYLKEQGYRLISQNFRSPQGEIDLIAEDKKENAIVFVEVKSSRTDYYDPSFKVNRRKQRKILRTALRFIKRYRLYNTQYSIRFDIITVILTDNNFKITHIKDAFQVSRW